MICSCRYRAVTNQSERRQVRTQQCTAKCLFQSTSCQDAEMVTTDGIYRALFRVSPVHPHGKCAFSVCSSFGPHTNTRLPHFCETGLGKSECWAVLPVRHDTSSLTTRPDVLYVRKARVYQYRVTHAKFSILLSRWRFQKTPCLISSINSENPGERKWDLIHDNFASEPHSMNTPWVVRAFRAKMESAAHRTSGRPEEGILIAAALRVRLRQCPLIR